MLTKLMWRVPRRWVLWADGGDRGKLLLWAWVTGGWVIEVVKKPARPSSTSR